MKRRPLRWALLLGLVLAVAWLAWGLWRSEGHIHDLPPPGPQAQAQAQDAVARGSYLARAGNCMLCHTDRGGAAYAGGRAIDTPFGTVYATNLTPDARTGLGAWTPGDFWRAMHHGRSRDGRLLYPAFPYPNYTQVTRADADALFAYLRTLPPVQRENRAHQLRWPYSTQAALVAWRALFFRPGVHEDEPQRSAEWNRGAYLVRGLGHCSACHASRNALGAGDVMDLTGGMIPTLGWYAPSLASDTEAGVAGWAPAHIVQLLKTGTSPAGSALGPMAEVVLHSTQYLADEDLRAMATFLQAVPAAQAESSAPPRPVSPTVAQRGSQLYGRHCASCHGEQGEGVPGAYPRLAGSRSVLMPQTANLVQVAIHGGYPPATQGNPRPFGMPPFATVLSDADLAAVLTHIRNAWGNQAGAVSELDVVQQRSARY